MFRVCSYKYEPDQLKTKPNKKKNEGKEILTLTLKKPTQLASSESKKKNS